MLSRSAILRTGLVLGAVALPIVALAAHGKAGLWEISTHMNMPGMSAQIPPEALARMRAMGVQMPDSQTFTTQHCMTAEEVAADKPPPMRNTKDCAVANMTHDAHTINVDMTCTGEMQGNGHLTLTYDSDEHYSGKYTFTGSAHGHQTTLSNSFDGKWISADCGSAK